jgi:hypothetical protein
VNRFTLVTAFVLAPILGCAAPAAVADPYGAYRAVRGDLHVHAMGSFDVPSHMTCDPPYRSGPEQIAAAQAAHLDFVALTEHDRDPRSSGGRLGPAGWQAILSATSRATTPGRFVALPGYEWTATFGTPLGPGGPKPDYDHKVVVLPPGAATYCGVDDCPDPDALSAFVQRGGGVVITPHAWRVTIEGTSEAYEKDYYAYRADGAGDTFVGTEVEPDFNPVQWDPTNQKRPVTSRSSSLAAWTRALESGKHLAAIGDTDSHGDCMPLGRRSTVVFVRELTAGAILDALRARRTMSAHLEPLGVRLTVDGHIVGETSSGPGKIRVEVSEVDKSGLEVEIFAGGLELLDTPVPESGVVEHTVPPGTTAPVWAKLTKKSELDPDTRTPRATITSPIWLTQPR